MSEIQPYSYESVAEGVGLSGVRLRRYIKYMKTRWSLSEREKCKEGMAKEWASRFLHGFEWDTSDEQGKVVLSRIYQEEEGKVEDSRGLDCSRTSGENRGF